MNIRIATALIGLFAWLCGVCTPAAPALALNCSASMTNVNFASFDPTTGAVDDSTGTLTMNCSGAGNKPIRICVNINGGVDFDATSRFMIGPGGARLRYQLYTDAARTIPWGSDSPRLYGGGVQWDVSPSGGTATFTTTVYGRIFANQQSTPQGVYSSLLSLVATFDGKSVQPCPDPGDGTTSTQFLAAVAATTSCTVSASNLNFGNITLLANNVDATSNITAQCANGVPYNIGLSAGNGPSATVAVRQMTQGANTLSYSLYRDSSRTAIWGNTIGTDTVAATGTGLSQSFIVFGRIPPQTIPGPGAYADTIIVTLTF